MPSPMKLLRAAAVAGLALLASSGTQVAAQIGPILLFQCNDRIDNDGDGKIDYPAEPGCSSGLDNNEADPSPLPVCADGRDNDRDGYIDYPADPQCLAASFFSEGFQPANPQCSDGADNDNDGKTDFPNEPGCTSADDTSEADPSPLPVCSNGLDDDLDGKVDYPAEDYCRSAADTYEGPGACADGIDNDGDQYADFPNDAGCESPADLTELDPVPPPLCRDGVDNDGDGYIDHGGRNGDPGCASASANDEGPHICEDNTDNDGDGKKDFPNDPGCESLKDLTEADPFPVPECGDGKDNDRDGFIDYPRDTTCTSASQTSEGPRSGPQCDDGVDNDNDGKLDYPYDSGCLAATDTVEDNPNPEPECSDGVDNDNDGLKDFPADSDCGSAGDDTERYVQPGGPDYCQNCVCNADINGDGDTDAETELRQCDYHNGYSLCPIAREACMQDQLGAWSCPSDNSAACVNTGSGPRMCSPNKCFKQGSTITETSDVNQPEPTNDGPVGPDGSCLGTLRVFAGRGMRCRKAGTQTLFQGCCSNEMPPLNDTMGEAGGKNQREYKKQASFVEFYKNQCDIQDQETALLNESNYCVEVGEFCAEKWITGCVQKSKSYCCFSSQLGKIIQVEGRKQIPEMGGFGTPKAPVCKGFTMEQFQSLDFSKIDLSSYYATIRTESQQVMKQKAQANAEQNANRR